MKRMLLFAALCASVLFTNCKKDADPTIQELIVGKWKVTIFNVSGQNIIQETAILKVAAELEFKTGADVIFKFTSTNLAVNPPSVSSNSKTNTYSWNGDILTISATSGTETVSVTGPVTVTESKLVFTPTSGDTDKLFASLEAEKI
jgi:hypothetical protein